MSLCFQYHDSYHLATLTIQTIINKTTTFNTQTSTFLTHTNVTHTLICTAPLAPETLEKVKAAFKVVNYHPDGNVPEAALKAAEVFFCEGPGLPPALRDVKTELPAVKLVQLSAAGADKILAGEAMKAYAEGTDRSVTLCTASGLHVLSIPNYVVASIINANHQIPDQIHTCMYTLDYRRTKFKTPTLLRLPTILTATLR
ncbi:hypothetical protein IAT38_003009 [Cryptococcus sp. DSM 104549]